MGWNRKSMMKVGLDNGFKGKTADEFVAFVTENGLELEGLDSEVKIKAAFNKTVYITPDAGEEVVINKPDGEEPEDPETLKMEGEDEEDDAEMKAFRQFRKFQKSTQATLQNGAKNPAAEELPQRKRFGDARSAKMLAYDRKIKDGTKLSKTGHAPVFGDAERMEVFNAAMRLTAMGAHAYPMKSFDEKLLTKTHVVGINSDGGNLVFGEYFPEVIENFSSYGAARAAVGVTNMSEGVWTGPKLEADITVGDIGEGGTMTSSKATIGNVTITAKKSYALAKLSMELLNDSAVNAEDTIVSSMFRAMRAHEDNCFFNSASNREGLSSKIGSNSTIDSNLAARTPANWGGYVSADMQNAIGSLPAWASEDPNFGIACSWQFYMTVMRNIALSAGGTTGAAILAGVSGGPGLQSRWEWDGIPIYINNKGPKSYNADQIDLYVGAFSHSCKLGVVTGSETVTTSDQRWFDQDLFAIKMTQRWGINTHGVNNEALSASTDAGSGVIALKA